MDSYTIIKAFGLETRTWTYREDYGYGCAECCNGDRCDEDCTAKYRRPNCPHCKGRGWIKKEDIEPMTNNTQLPAEVIKKIEKDSQDYAAVYPFPGSLMGYKYAATEYATKQLQEQQEIEQLKQWKAEASALLNPILDYGKSKEAGIPLGESITSVVLERCKQYDTARTLLESVLPLLPGTSPIHDNIQTFLDGTR